MSTNVYIGYYKIGSPNGPGTNEKDFFLDVAESENSGHWYFVSAFAKGIADSSWPHISFRRTIRVPFVRDFLIIIQFARIFIEARGNISSICFRIARYPIAAAVILLFFCRNTEKTHVKTIGPGLCRNFSKRTILNRFEFYLTKYVLSRACTIDTPTRIGKELIQTTFGIHDKNILVIPNGARDPLSFDSTKFNGTLTLGYIGRFPEVRGGRQVIEALPELIRMQVQTIAYITGDKAEILNLEKLAIKLGVDEHVKFVGILGPEELSKLFGKIDIGFSVVENIKGTSGQKLRQYLVHGCSVVFQNDEYFEDLPDTKFVHQFSNSLDAANFAKFINGLLELVNGRSALRVEISNWAGQYLSYRKFNSVRLQQLR